MIGKSEIMNSVKIWGLWLALLVSGCTTDRPDHVNEFRKQFKEPPTVRIQHYYKGQSKREAQGQNKRVAVAAAVSGGGHRAANFAAGVLMALENYTTADKEKINLLQEIDYFSTVSGGSFGVGGYIASLAYHLRDNKGSFAGYSLTDAYQKGLNGRLRKSYQGKLLSALFNPKILFSRYDRGDVVERQIDNVLLNHGSRMRLKQQTLRLSDMFIARDDSRTARLPLMVANGTIYANSAIFPFTPKILEAYRIKEFNHRVKKRKMKMKPNGSRVYDLPLSVAIKASASFPFVITETTLRSEYSEKLPFLHIQDGGVAENLGYETAINILQGEPQGVRKVLLVIDAYNKNDSPFSGSERAPNWFSLAYKLVNSGLESKHRNVYKRIQARCKAAEIDVIFLDFRSLVVEGAPAEQLILYKKAREIKTRLKLSREEQRLLLKIAEKVVAKKKERIDQCLVGALRGIDRKKCPPHKPGP